MTTPPTNAPNGAPTNGAPNAPKAPPGGALAPTDPVFAVVYGDEGVGKTTDALATFPDALVLARRGGTAPSWSYLQIPGGIRLLLTSTLAEASECLDLALAEKRSAVILDDASLTGQVSEYMIAQAGTKGWDLQDLLAEQALVLAERALNKGIHLLINAHEWAPGKNRPRGGPSFPYVRVQQAITHRSNLLLRAVVDPTRTYAWKVVYRAADPAWKGKDKVTTGGAVDPAPPNLRALLRRAGYRCPRAPGLGWQDEVAYGVVLPALLAGEAPQELMTRVYAACVGLAPAHLDWAWRDGFAAWELEATVRGRTAQDRFWGAPEVKTSGVTLA